jgi:WhiB family transcriptional regulator, redox-sensing transcriptional regulator
MTVVSKALKPVADNWEWQFEGACNGIKTDEFFLEDNMRGKTKRLREVSAVAICNTCPVKQQCLDHALSVPEVYGVWGGMTEEQRHALAKKLGITYGYIRI